MDDLDQVFASAAARQISQEPTIICLYTAARPPEHAAPMQRLPAPQTGQMLDGAFADHVAAAIAVNAAVHDGAVMLGRKNDSTPYRISGWSYRLYPPSIPNDHEPNRGSAFNSCLAMSTVTTVDRLYLITRRTLYRFENGLARRL